MKKTVYIFVTIVCFLGISSSVHAFTFTRTLSLGSTGQDVLELQKILNRDSRTQIATQGVGSPGQETNYFGQLTQQSVIKFQNLHADKILYPLGLSQGTGFVGNSTINFLNTLSISSSSQQTTQAPAINNDPIQTIPTLPNQTTSQNSAALFYPLVQASHPAEYQQVGRGRELVDKSFDVASGFDLSEIDFFLNGVAMTKRCSKYTSYVCSVYIDKDTKPGTYTLSTNKPKMGSHQFKVVNLSIPYPEVFTKNIKLGEDTLIQGKNFTDTMTVYTMFGTYKTDTLNDSFILNISSTYNLPESKQSTLYVENKHGLRSNTLLVSYEK